MAAKGKRLLAAAEGDWSGALIGAMQDSHANSQEAVDGQLDNDDGTAIDAAVDIGKDKAETFKNENLQIVKDSQQQAAEANNELDDEHIEVEVDQLFDGNLGIELSDDLVIQSIAEEAQEIGWTVGDAIKTIETAPIKNKAEFERKFAMAKANLPITFTVIRPLVKDEDDGSPGKSSTAASSSLPRKVKKAKTKKKVDAKEAKAEDVKSVPEIKPEDELVDTGADILVERLFNGELGVKVSMSNLAVLNIEPQAKEFGWRIGDKIVAIKGQQIADATDYRRELDYAKDELPFSISVSRKRTRVSVERENVRKELAALGINVDDSETSVPAVQEVQNAVSNDASILNVLRGLFTSGFCESRCCQANNLDDLARDFTVSIGSVAEPEATTANVMDELEVAMMAHVSEDDSDDDSDDEGGDEHEPGVRKKTMPLSWQRRIEKLQKKQEELSELAKADRKFTVPFTDLLVFSSAMDNVKSGSADPWGCLLVAAPGVYPKSWACGLFWSMAICVFVGLGIYGNSCRVTEGPECKGTEKVSAYDPLQVPGLNWVWRGREPRTGLGNANATEAPESVEYWQATWNSMQDSNEPQSDGLVGANQEPLICEDWDGRTRTCSQFEVCPDPRLRTFANLGPVASAKRSPYGLPGAFKPVRVEDSQRNSNMYMRDKCDLHVVSGDDDDPTTSNPGHSTPTDLDWVACCEPALCDFENDEKDIRTILKYVDDRGLDDIPDDRAEIESGFVSSDGTFSIGADAVQEIESGSVGSKNSFFIGLDALQSLSEELTFEVCAISESNCNRECFFLSPDVVSVSEGCPEVDSLNTPIKKAIGILAGICGEVNRSNPRTFVSFGSSVLQGWGKTINMGYTTPPVSTLAVLEDVSWSTFSGYFGTAQKPLDGGIILVPRGLTFNSTWEFGWDWDAYNENGMNLAHNLKDMTQLLIRARKSDTEFCSSARKDHALLFDMFDVPHEVDNMSSLMDPEVDVGWKTKNSYWAGVKRLDDLPIRSYNLEVCVQDTRSKGEKCKTVCFPLNEDTVIAKDVCMCTQPKAKSVYHDAVLKLTGACKAVPSECHKGAARRFLRIPRGNDLLWWWTCGCNANVCQYVSYYPDKRGWAQDSLDGEERPVLGYQIDAGKEEFGYISAGTKCSPKVGYLWNRLFIRMRQAPVHEEEPPDSFSFNMSKEYWTPIRFFYLVSIIVFLGLIPLVLAVSCQILRTAKYDRMENDMDAVALISQKTNVKRRKAQWILMFYEFPQFLSLCLIPAWAWSPEFPIPFWDFSEAFSSLGMDNAVRNAGAAFYVYFSISFIFLISVTVQMVRFYLQEQEVLAARVNFDALRKSIIEEKANIKDKTIEDEIRFSSKRTASLLKMTEPSGQETHEAGKNTTASFLQLLQRQTSAHGTPTPKSHEEEKSKIQETPSPKSQQEKSKAQETPSPKSHNEEKIKAQEMPAPNSHEDEKNKAQESPTPVPESDQAVAQADVDKMSNQSPPTSEHSSKDTLGTHCGVITSTSFMHAEVKEEQQQDILKTMVSGSMGKTISFVATLILDTAFLPTMTMLFSKYECTYYDSQGRYYVHSRDTVLRADFGKVSPNICWTDEHLAQAIIAAAWAPYLFFAAVLYEGYYKPSAEMVKVNPRTKEGAQNLRPYRNLPRFAAFRCIIRMLAACVVGFCKLHSPTAGAGLLCILFCLLWWANRSLQPVLGYGTRPNCWVSGYLLACIWAAFLAFISVVCQDSAPGINEAAPWVLVFSPPFFIALGAYINYNAAVKALPQEGKFTETEAVGMVDGSASNRITESISFGREVTKPSILNEKNFEEITINWRSKLNALARNSFDPMPIEKYLQWLTRIQGEARMIDLYGSEWKRCDNCVYPQTLLKTRIGEVLVLILATPSFEVKTKKGKSVSVWDPSAELLKTLRQKDISPFLRSFYFTTKTKSLLGPKVWHQLYSVFKSGNCGTGLISAYGSTFMSGSPQVYMACVRLETKQEGQIQKAKKDAKTAEAKAAAAAKDKGEKGWLNSTEVHEMLHAECHFPVPKGIFAIACQLANETRKVKDAAKEPTKKNEVRKALKKFATSGAKAGFGFMLSMIMGGGELEMPDDFAPSLGDVEEFLSSVGDVDFGEIEGALEGLGESIGEGFENLMDNAGAAINVFEHFPDPFSASASGNPEDMANGMRDLLSAGIGLASIAVAFTPAFDLAKDAIGVAKALTTKEAQLEEKTPDTVYYPYLHHWLCKLFNGSMHWLGHSLPKLYMLESLHLAHCNIGVMGLFQLSLGLRGHPSLKRLYLQDNGLDNAGYKENTYAAIRLASVFGDLCSATSSKIHRIQLNKVPLPVARLRDGGERAFKRFTCVHRSKDYKLQIFDMAVISYMIRNNAKMTHFQVDDSNMADEGAEFLAMSLLFNKSLESLSCVNCGFKRTADDIFEGDTAKPKGDNKDFKKLRPGERSLAYALQGSDHHILGNELSESLRKACGQVPGLGNDNVRRYNGIQMDGVEKLDLTPRYSAPEYLYGDRMSLDEASFIGDRIKSNKPSNKNMKIKELICHKGNMDFEVGPELAHGIKKNDSIVLIDFDHNRLADKGVKSLAKSMEAHTVLSSFRIGWNHLSAKCMDDLARLISANLVLQELWLPENGEKDETWDTGILKMFEVLATKNKNLKRLNLFKNPSTQAGEEPMVPIVRKATGLTEVNQINLESDTVDISKRDHRMTLYEAAFLGERLQADKVVKRVNVRDSCVTSKAFEVLRKGWPENNATLTALNLTSNIIGDTKTGATMIAEILAVQKTISEFDMLDNSMNEEAQIEIAKAFYKNKGVSLLNFVFTVEQPKVDISKGSEICKKYEQFRKERAIEVYEAAFLGNRLDPEQAAKPSDCQELILPSCQFTDPCSKELSHGLNKNKTVQALDLRDNVMDDQGGEHIADIIKENTSIKKLVVAENKLKDKAGLSLFKSMTSNQALVDFDILDQKDSGITRNGEMDMAHLVPKNATLVRLNRDVKIKDEKALDLSSRKDGTGANRCLALYEACFIGDRMKVSSTFVDLNLNHNQVDKQAVDFVCEGVIVRQGLETLKLSHNALKDDGMTCVASAVGSHKGVKVLHLVENEITDVGSDKAAEMVVTNTVVEELDIRKNSIQKGANLAEAFRENSTVLKFNEMDLRQEECKYENYDGVGTILAEIGFVGTRLKHPKCLCTLLDLSKDHVTDEGCVFLADGMKDNPDTLCTMILNHNNFKTSGVEVLAARALAANKKKLTMFSIVGNSIGSDGNQHVMDAFQNKNKIVCSYNGLDIRNASLVVKTADDEDKTYLSSCDFVGSRMSQGLSKVVELNASEASLDDPKMDAISKGLPGEKVCKKMTVKTNKFGDEAASNLAERLVKNQTVNNFNIMENENISEVADRKFNETFDENQTISTFNELILAVKDVNIQSRNLRLMDQGFIGIRLGQSTIIASMIFGQNNFNDEGIVFFGKGLGQNKTIGTLKMLEVTFPSNCGKVLGTGVDVNGSLQILFMPHDTQLNAEEMFKALSATSQIKNLNDIQVISAVLTVGGAKLIEYEMHFVQGLLQRPDVGCATLRVITAAVVEDAWWALCGGVGGRSGRTIHLALDSSKLVTQQLQEIMSAGGDLGNVECRKNEIGPEGCTVIGNTMPSSGCHNMFIEENGLDYHVGPLLAPGVTTTLKGLYLGKIGEVGYTIEEECGTKNKEKKETQKTCAPGSNNTVTWTRTKHYEVQLLRKAFYLHDEWRILWDKCQSTGTKLTPDDKDYKLPQYEGPEIPSSVRYDPDWTIVKQTSPGGKIMRPPDGF